MPPYLSAIIAAWQIPFYCATDIDAVMATWAGLATDRVHLDGLVKHIVMYPIETFACLLPWSPILVALMKRETRALIADQKPLVSFLLVALAVAYPTVWVVAGAQARYFMPLYPLVAVLVGLVVERCSARRLADTRAGPGISSCCYQYAVGVLSLLVLSRTQWALGIYQPQWFSLAFVAIAATVVAILWSCYRTGSPQRATHGRGHDRRCLPASSRPAC